MTICKGQMQKGLPRVDKHTSLCFLHYWLDWNRSYGREIKNHVTSKGSGSLYLGFEGFWTTFSSSASSSLSYSRS